MFILMMLQPRRGLSKSSSSWHACLVVFPLWQCVSFVSALTIQKLDNRIYAGKRASYVSIIEEDIRNYTAKVSVLGLTSISFSCTVNRLTYQEYNDNHLQIKVNKNEKYCTSFFLLLELSGNYTIKLSAQVGNETWTSETLSVDVVDNFRPDCLQNLKVNATVNGQPAEILTYFSEMDALTVTTSSTISLHIITACNTRRLSYTMERISETHDEGNCFASPLGQVDLEKYNREKTYIPGKFRLQGERLDFPPGSLPVGDLRLTITMAESWENYVYLRVNPTSQYEGYQLKMKPEALRFQWPLYQELKIEAVNTKSFYMSQSSGYSKSIYNQETVEWTCTGMASACQKITKANSMIETKIVIPEDVGVIDKRVCRSPQQSTVVKKKEQTTKRTTKRTTKTPRITVIRNNVRGNRFARDSLLRQVTTPQTITRPVPKGSPLLTSFLQNYTKKRAKRTRNVQGRGRWRGRRPINRRKMARPQQKKQLPICKPSITLTFKVTTSMRKRGRLNDNITVDRTEIMAKAIRRIQFLDNRLMIDLRCILNCRGVLNMHAPLMLLAHIRNKEAPQNVTYKWEVTSLTDNDVSGSETMYMTVPVATIKKQDQLQVTLTVGAANKEDTTAYHLFRAEFSPEDMDNIVVTATKIESYVSHQNYEFSMRDPGGSGLPARGSPFLYSLVTTSATGECLFISYVNSVVFAIYNKNTELQLSIHSSAGTKLKTNGTVELKTSIDARRVLQIDLENIVQEFSRSKDFGLDKMLILAMIVNSSHHSQASIVLTLYNVLDSMLYKQITYHDAYLELVIIQMIYNKINVPLNKEIPKKSLQMLEAISKELSEVVTDSYERVLELARRQFSLLHTILSQRQERKKSALVLARRAFALVPWIGNYLAGLYSNQYSFERIGDKDAWTVLVGWLDVTEPGPTEVWIPIGGKIASIVINKKEFYRQLLKLGVTLNFYVNIVIYHSSMNAFSAARRAERYNLGITDIHIFSKSLRERLSKVGTETEPVAITYNIKSVVQEDVTFNLTVVKNNGKVVDSTCRFVTTDLSTTLNRQLEFQSTEGYLMVYSYMLALDSKSYINIFDKEVTPATEPLYLPFVDKMYSFMYPESRYYILVRITDTTEDNETSVMPVKLESNKTGEKDKISQEVVTVSIESLNLQCAHWDADAEEWDEYSCIVDKGREKGKLNCRCNSTGPYSGAIKRDFSNLGKIDRVKVVKAGLYFNIVTFVAVVWFCYLAFVIDARRQDVNEKYACRTHVLVDNFHWSSADIYLVCVSTGMWPRSGTSNRIGLTLVGCHGASDYIVLDGPFIYWSGSEIWFLLSCDLFLGYLEGIIVSHETSTANSTWLLTSVTIYSLSQNWVYVFHADKWLSSKAPRLDLPTKPVRHDTFYHCMTRFFSKMRKYHLVASLILPLPGSPYTRVQHATTLLTVVLATMCYCMRKMGFPKMIIEGNDVFEFNQSLLPKEGFHLGVVMFIFHLIVSSFFIRFMGGSRSKIMWAPTYKTISEPDEETEWERAATPKFDRSASSEESEEETEDSSEEEEDEEEEDSDVSLKGSVSSVNVKESSLWGYEKPPGNTNVTNNSLDSQWGSYRHSREMNHTYFNNNQYTNFMAAQHLPDPLIYQNWLNDTRYNCLQKVTDCFFPCCAKNDEYTQRLRSLKTNVIFGGHRNHLTHRRRPDQSSRQRPPNLHPHHRGNHMRTITTKRAEIPRRSIHGQRDTKAMGDQSRDISNNKPDPLKREQPGSSKQEPVTSGKADDGRSKSAAKKDNPGTSNPQSTNVKSPKDKAKLATDGVKSGKDKEKSVATKVSATDTSQKRPKPGQETSEEVKDSNNPEGEEGEIESDRESTDDIKSLPDSYDPSQSVVNKKAGKIGAFRKLKNKLKGRESFRRLLKTVRTNLVWMFIVLLCIAFSYYLAVYGLYYKKNDNLRFLIISSTACYVCILLIEPAFLLIVSFIQSMYAQGGPHLVDEALKRASVIDAAIQERGILEHNDIVKRTRQQIRSKLANESSVVRCAWQNDLLNAFKINEVPVKPHVLQEGVPVLVCFVIVTVVIMNLHASVYTSFHQNNYIQQILNNGPADYYYDRTTSVFEVWHYLRSNFIPMIQRKLHQTEVSNIYVMTVVRLRQIRVVPREDCYDKSPDAFQFRSCNEDLENMEVETRNFNETWDIVFDEQILAPTVYNALDNDPFLYREGYMFDQFNDILRSYPRGGYEVLLQTEGSGALDTLLDLEESKWVDQHTRALILDMSLYNGDTDTVTTMSMLFPFSKAGIRMVSHSFSYRLYSRGMIIMTLRFMVAILGWLNIYNILKEAIMCFHMKCKAYFERVATYVELFKITLCSCVVIGFVLREVVRVHLASDLSKSYGAEGGGVYVSFKSLAQAVIFVNVCSGLLAFSILWQVLKSVKDNQRLHMFFQLVVSSVQLFVPPAFLAMAFASWGRILFGRNVEQFSSIHLSVSIVIQQLVRPQPFVNELNKQFPLFGPAYAFLLYTILCIAMINFFIVFLNEAYSTIKFQVEMQMRGTSGLTILDYLLSKFHWSSKDDDDDDGNKQEQISEEDFAYDIKMFHLNR